MRWPSRQSTRRAVFSMKAQMFRIPARPGRVLGSMFAAAALGFALLATPALAESSKGPSQFCAPAEFSQPFLSFGDQGSYTLVPDGNFSEASGRGWQLSGGAQIVTATLPNGTAGRVLSLPGGAQAVSPPMCVDALYVNVRAWVQSLNQSPGVNVTAIVPGPRQSQSLSGNSNGGWTLPPIVNVLPGIIPLATQAQFVVQGKGSSGASLVYDIYVDPRMR
jgi:hypothetical protein